MPFNGSGTYSPPAAPTFPAVPNTLIESSKFNTVINDVATALTNCMTRDGQSPATANIPMGNFKLTGLAVGVADTDGVAVSQAPVLKGSIGASDWDTLIKYGLYEAVAASLTGPAANFPPTSDIGQLLVMVQGATINQLYTTKNGFYYRSKVAAVWSAWTSSPLMIFQNTTYTIGTDFATVRAAMAFLKGRQIDVGVTVTLAMPTGTITETGGTPISLNHPQGSQIVIDGNGVGTSIWNVSGAGGNFPLRLDAGHTFGTIQQLTITGSATQNVITVDDHSTLLLLSQVDFQTAQIAMDMQENSRIVTATQISETAVSTIINVEDDSFMRFISSSVSALMRVEASVLQIESIVNTGGAGVGLTLTRGATLLSSTNTITNWSGNGILCENGSEIIVFPTFTLTSQNNGAFGISYSDAIRARGTVAGAGNVSGLESAALDLDGGTILATTGDITMTPGAGSNVRFGTFTGAADAASTGYIEIKDAGGTIRRVMVRA